MEEESNLAQIEVHMDHKAIRKYVQEKIDEIIKDFLIMWDINEMAKRMCMSKSFIENEFLHDPRMRVLERRKDKGKRFWFYRKSLAVMEEIMDEW